MTTEKMTTTLNGTVTLWPVISEDSPTLWVWRKEDGGRVSRFFATKEQALRFPPK